MAPHDGDDAHTGGAHDALPSEPVLRVQALETLLARKGLIEPEALEAIIETYANDVGPRNGAQVVAKAWRDSGFRDWLLRDASAAIASLGFEGRQGEHMVAVENTEEVHNLVVCTLCSCCPWPRARAAAGLVQVGGLPVTRGARAAFRAR
jgi:nitrile hydratase subunit alpha